MSEDGIQGQSVSEQIEYTFRSAASRAEYTWTIKDGHLMRRGGASAFDLSKVTEAVWADLAYRGTRSSWLNLKAGENTLKLECTDHGSWGNRRPFLALIEQVCGQLEARAPQAQIRIDGGSAFIRAMFIVGLIGVLVGLGFFGAGLTGQFAVGRVFAIMGGALISLFGAWLAYGYAPWKQYYTIRPAELAAQISRG